MDFEELMLDYLGHTCGVRGLISLRAAVHAKYSVIFDPQEPKHPVFNPNCRVNKASLSSSPLQFEHLLDCQD